MQIRLTHYLLEILRNKKTKYAIFLLFFFRDYQFLLWKVSSACTCTDMSLHVCFNHAMNYSCGITSFSSIQVLNQETGVSWNSASKRQFGTMTKVSMNMNGIDCMICKVQIKRFGEL